MAFNEAVLDWFIRVDEQLILLAQADVLHCVWHDNIVLPEEFVGLVSRIPQELLNSQQVKVHQLLKNTPSGEEGYAIKDAYLGKIISLEWLYENLKLDTPEGRNKQKALRATALAVMQAAQAEVHEQGRLHWSNFLATHFAKAVTSRWHPDLCAQRQHIMSAYDHKKVITVWSHDVSHVLAVMIP